MNWTVFFATIATVGGSVIVAAGVCVVHKWLEERTDHPELWVLVALILGAATFLGLTVQP
jgi:hypothetical protein